MFRLRTLGGVLIEGPDGPLTGAASQRRRLAVLALLAASGNGISRDRLVALLWPESGEERARHALAQLLYSLRRELGAEVVTGSATALRLDASAVSSDVQDFLDALESDDDERAADLYGGPFLDGFYLSGCAEFERWVEVERARLAQLARAALERLATRFEQAGDRARAIVHWRRLVSLDPYNTQSTLALVRALAAAGDRGGALRQARIHEELLRNQLDAEPDPAITAFAASLAGAPPRPEPARAAAPASAPGEASVATTDGGLDPGKSSGDSPTPSDDASGPPASAVAPAAAESAVPARTGFGPERSRHARRLTVAGVAVLVTVAVMSGLYLGGLFDGMADDGPPDWVLVADVETESGDSVLDRTVPFALAAGLRQSRGIYVVPPERIQQTLVRMRETGAAVIDESLAREIAQRDGVRFVIVPGIQQAADGFTLAARIIEPATGGALAVANVHARDRDEILDALDRLSRRIRRATGESALRVATRSTPLPEVTTRSLAALEKYASGNRAFVAGLWREAEILWLDAIAIDSTFAAAHANLGMFAYWTNRAAEGERRFAHAIAHLDGLSERERTLIRARIESWRNNREASVALLRAMLIEQPDDLDALRLLGYDYLRLNRDREGADVFRRLLRLDSMDHATWINLASVEKALGEYDSAIAHYRRAFSLLPSMETGNSNINHEFGSTFVLAGLPDSATAVFSRMLAGGRDVRVRGLRSLAFLAMYRGHYAEASRLLAEAVRLNSMDGSRTAEIRNRLLLAVSLEHRGLAVASRAQLDSAYVLAIRMDTDPILMYWLGKALVRNGDTGRAALLLDTVNATRHPDNVSARAAAEALRGEIMVAHGDASAALPHLERALRDDSSKITLESLAHGVATTGDLERAGRLYEELSRYPSFGHEAQEPWRMAPYRLALIAEASGDPGLAARALEQFLENWSEAEPALPILLDAQSRLGQLRAATR